MDDAKSRVEVAIGAMIERADGAGRNRGESIGAGEGNWRVLVTRRPNTTVYPGYWELPGGKIDVGETPQQCLVREFEEELGIVIEVGDALPMVEHAYDHAHVLLHPFYCRHVSGELKNLGVAEHRWVEPAELLNLKLPEANESITQRIIDDLTSR